MDPDAQGAPVSWAGLEPAPAWLEAGPGRPGAPGGRAGHFLRALPFTLRDTEAEAGTQLLGMVSIVR
jgi:hypothetical protein